MRKKRNLSNRILAVMLSIMLAGGGLQGSALAVQASSVDETVPVAGQEKASAQSKNHSHAANAANAEQHADWIAWNNTSEMPNTEGSYYLTVDVELSGTEWTVRGTTNLCLNGHTITQDGRDRVINVPRGATLNLYDEKGNTGKITGGNADPRGGGILVEGTCTMNGGQVTGNKVHCDKFEGEGGAGISVYGGQFTMNGGSICDNHFDNRNPGFHGGGITVNSSGKVTMTGGEDYWE